MRIVRQNLPCTRAAHTRLILLRKTAASKFCLTLQISSVMKHRRLYYKRTFILHGKLRLTQMFAQCVSLHLIAPVSSIRGFARTSYTLTLRKHLERTMQAVTFPVQRHQDCICFFANAS